jgi:hypothetical protein
VNSFGKPGKIYYSDIHPAIPYPVTVLKNVFTTFLGLEKKVIKRQPNRTTAKN